MKIELLMKRRSTSHSGENEQTHEETSAERSSFPASVVYTFLFFSFQIEMGARRTRSLSAGDDGIQDGVRRHVAGELQR